MGRWRDIKQGKEVTHNEQETSKESLDFDPCAPLSRRLKAFLTDLFLITTPIFYIVIYLIMGSGEAFSENRGNGWLMILGVNLPIIVAFWLIKAQTPGMKAYSLKLLTSSKQKVNLFQALLRYVLTLIALLSIILLFIPFLRKDKRTFQDIFSNTYIIQLDE